MGRQRQERAIFVSPFFFGKSNVSINKRVSRNTDSAHQGLRQRMGALAATAEVTPSPVLPRGKPRLRASLAGCLAEISRLLAVFSFLKGNKVYLTAVGSKFFYSTSFGPKKTVDSVTNADPAVATSTAHGFANGKELLLLNGWEDAAESIWRSTAVAANTVTLEDLDTSDTEWFPSGTASSGTLQEVSNWQEIGQVLDVSSTGGGRRDITVSPLARRNSIVLPAGFEASGIDFTLGFDPSRVDQKAMDKISRRLSQRVAFKFVLPGGAKLYAYGFLQKSGLPQMASQDVMKVNVSCSFLGMVSTYVDV